MNRNLFAGSLTVETLLAPAARTSTATGTGVDLQPYDGNVAVLVHNGTTSGTTPTLAVKIQDSDDDSTYADVSGATASFTAAGHARIVINSDQRRRYIRAVATIGGTTPSFNCCVLAVALANG